MLNLKWIREQPEEFQRALKRRGIQEEGTSIISLDADHRALIAHIQALQEERNALAKKIPELKKQGADISETLAQANTVKERLPILEEKESTLREILHDRLARLPNCLAPDVPDGCSDADNVCMKTWGTPPSFSFTPKAHYELGEELGLLNFQEAATMSGARFAVLKGALARLERALGAFMLDIHTKEFGYEEVSPPLLVRDNAAFGVGQLPKFEEDLFKTTTGHYLISTAEVPLTNLVQGKILEEKTLPLRFTAYTPCFRSEAGAAGKDTRGMIRMHQFYKVELVSITTRAQAEAEHERMLAAAEEILQRLELPYRVMLLCAGDTSSASRKTYDLEVWLPSQKTYREISSCSSLGDYQARRMNTRYRPEVQGSGKSSPEFVFTLNGSGLAVGRTLVALLENFQRSDGTIEIPKALRPYTGFDRIKKS